MPPQAQKRGVAYRSTTDEEDGDGDMLQVSRSPFASPAANMLEENIGRAIED